MKVYWLAFFKNITHSMYYRVALFVVKEIAYARLINTSVHSTKYEIHRCIFLEFINKLDLHEIVDL